MSDFLATYFGPLSKQYCLYFYILSIFFGFIFVLAILGMIYAIIKYHKKITSMAVLNMVSLLANIFLAYFVNRLLHTMCLNSTH